MKDYRLYLQGQDGRFKSVVEFTAPDEALALAMAHRHADGHACELWRGAVFVAKVRPPDGLEGAGALEPGA